MIASKLCGAVIVALVLALNSNIYALPLSDLLNAGKASSESSSSSSLSVESSESIVSNENTTINGTQKDL